MSSHTCPAKHQVTCVQHRLQGQSKDGRWLAWGRSSVLDMTILAGACPPSRLVVNLGLSLLTCAHTQHLGTIIFTRTCLSTGTMLREHMRVPKPYGVKLEVTYSLESGLQKPAKQLQAACK